MHGLTTAATIWVTAAMGVLCGLAAWRILVVGLPFVLLLLVFDGPFEKWCTSFLALTLRAGRGRP